jgi:hypothetical protein
MRGLTASVNMTLFQNLPMVVMAWHKWIMMDTKEVERGKDTVCEGSC